MSTFAELTDSTLLYLSGFSNMQDQSTYLTAGVDAATLTLPIADASAVSRGLVEIDDELIQVDNVNTTGLLLTAPPYGRGFRGTTAASHSSGARVVSAPMLPRKMVKNAINETIRSLFPDLYGVDSTTFTFINGQRTYPLPAGAQSAVQVQWQMSGYATEWEPVRRYWVDGNADTTVFPTGVSIDIKDFVVPGRSVHVVYTKEPTELSSNTDVFTTVTGLPASCEDLVRLGAAYRMIGFLDTPHLSGYSAEADFSSNMRPAGGAANLSKWMLQQYQIRLQQEQNKLSSFYPVRVRYTF